MEQVKSGDKITAKGWNDLAALASQGVVTGGGITSTGFGQNTVSAQRMEVVYFGTVTNTGPNSEADYTDERYWVKLAYTSNPTTDVATKAIALTAYTSGPFKQTYTVTNLAEALDHSHNLAVNTPVRIHLAWDVGGPPQRRYWMEAGGTGGLKIYVVSNLAAGGKYKGYIMTGVATDANLTGLTQGEEVIVLNGPEIGESYSTPLIQSATYTNGQVWGTDSVSGKKLVLVNTFSDEICPST